MCSKFCEPLGVPLLLGTASYGFNFEQIDEIIQSVLEYNETRITQCRGWASGFFDIQDSASKFIEELNVFTGAQQLYAAAILKAVADLRAEVQHVEFVNKMKRTSIHKKALTFKKKLTEGMDSLEQGAEKEKFKEKADLLEAAVNQLATTVQASLDGVSKFWEECNGLYLATSPEKEYLLDICEQGSGDEIDCIEIDGTAHLSCVCAYNPVILLGLESKTHSQDIMLGKNDGRRLSDQDMLKRAYANSKAVCPESWTNAQPEVTAMYQDIRAFGQESLFLDYDADMTTAYGEDYCGFPEELPPSSSPTPGPTWAPGWSLFVSTRFGMSQESLDALLADPAAAVVGLKNGIAQALDLQDTSFLEITRTVPNLLTRQLAEEEAHGPAGRAAGLGAGRRLEAKLTVDFEVVMTKESDHVEDPVDNLWEGDAGALAVLAFSVKSGLNAQSIDVGNLEAVVTNAGLITPEPTAVPTPAPTPPPDVVEDADSTLPFNLVTIVFGMMFTQPGLHTY
jgi:uncharacterized membrane protein YfbV (UPF0208 family)